ncbi:hypothetical protein [uncultured Streptomyces sp.]|uniref:hypothetical protein n=1 Tax=uncultured Streptomyces sp. TaxID=174707 RepID=UPI00262CCDF0|nr:hypothetical protein [uncultured Streptomyces sp.]
MEQSIDSNKKPVFAAGTDPAFIPGLTAPTSVGSEDGDEAAGPAPEDRTPEGGVPEDRVPGRDETSGTSGDTGADAPEDATAEAETAAEADVEGDASDTDGAAADEDQPVFEVSDRRGSIRVGPEGVRFTLDDQEAEFDWSEIGAVESKSARFGRRFTITVHLSTRRWFNAEVEAESRDRLKSWPDELDAVLDSYFEES